MRRLRAVCSLVLLLMLSQNSYGQTDQYRFSHLDITKGLSDNQVNCVFKDHKGFTWFGTLSGLCRYDGYKFKVFKHDPKDSNSISENHVVKLMEGPDNTLWTFTHSGLSIYSFSTEKFSSGIPQPLQRYKIHSSEVRSLKKDADGNFWFVTEKQGVFCYHPASKKADFYNTSQPLQARLYSDQVRDIALAPGKILWLIYSDGIVENLDTKAGRILGRYTKLAEANHFKCENYSATPDKNSNLWIYSDSRDLGVYMYAASSGRLKHLSKDSPENPINSNIINTIVEANDSRIWLGTDHGGINIIDPSTFKITYLMGRENDANSLSGNCVNLYKDPDGIIWAGTFKQGVNYYHNGIIQFPLYKHITADRASLPFEDVDCFAEDRNGRLWIGTNGGGLICYNRRTHTYKQYKHDPADPSSLSNDIIIRLFIDHNDQMWVGTYFGGLDLFDGKKFSHFHHSENQASISDDRIYTMLEDADKKVWVGAFAGGVNILDRNTRGFSHPRFSSALNYISILYKDRAQNTWIGQDHGLDVLMSKTHTLIHYVNKPSDANSLAGNDVNTVLEDCRGLIWVGTKDGLSILDFKSRKFLTAGAFSRLTQENVSNLLEDKTGTVWVSTTTGLLAVKLSNQGGTYTCQTIGFNEMDGLQGVMFNNNAALKLKSGELIFGGSHGFNLFNPTVINTYRPKQHLMFTDFQLFNKSVSVASGVQRHSVLHHSISETKAITLDPSENVFSIEFAACDYFNPDKIKYQYTLEGFDAGWISSPGTDRKATYTNLDGGDYVFRVKATNANNGDSSLIALKITVLPPFWKRPLAYLLYLLCFGCLILFMRHRGIANLKKQFRLKEEHAGEEQRLAKEREEARHTHQLDLMKIRFFTNISHDFRTPLTLILSPIDDLLDITERTDQRNHLSMIKRNGKRLLNLVNQLSDFRKMEYNELKLFVQEGDMVKFIREAYASFADIAHQKNIEYVFESEVHSFVTRFDHDKIERILFNLLSNAFKFTPSGGHISILVGLSDVQLTAAGAHKTLAIKIIDTGIGISHHNLDKIFDRFFQDELPDSVINQGSGIGLSITKEFVKMQGGTITVESEPDYGSCFTVLLPVGNHDQLEDVQPAEELFALAPTESETLSAASLRKQPTILLIEDSDDLRFYLKDNLKQHFHIIEAVNGKEGWQKALALHPELIVSDITMPEMNGIDLCKKIKGDSRTAQIPLILLTALAGEEQQLYGFESGANDYIVKPFNVEILLSKIQGLLKMQQTFKQTFQKQIELPRDQIVIVSEDEKFLKKVLQHIDLKLPDPSFSVEGLSKELSLSRVSLYRKLLLLTGKTPVDLIRSIRLKRALQLLEKSKLSISNVAYEVGFNNAAYFAKVFREEFGLLPSEYLVRIKRQPEEPVPVP